MILGDLETRIKKPLFSIFLLIAAFILCVNVIRDLLIGSWGQVPFSTLMLVLVLVSYVLKNKIDYEKNSLIAIIGTAVIQFVSLGVLGYHNEHNFYLIAFVLLLLVLVGTLFLNRLRYLVALVIASWLYFFVHILQAFLSGSIRENFIPVGEQLFIPILIFTCTTVLAIILRLIFRDITNEYRLVAEELSQRHKALGQLVRGIAHHLNSPLGNMRVLLSMFTEQSEYKVGKEVVDVLKAGTDTSLTLVSRLMNFLHHSEDMQTFSLDAAAVELHVLGKIGEQIQRERSQSYLDFFALSRLHHWNVIAFAMHELIDNALVFTPENSRPPYVVFDLEDGDTLCIAVYTADASMSKETSEKIFMPFVTSIRSEKHPGLGLYFAQHLIVQVLHGSLVWDPVGNGLRFSLRVPLLSQEI